MNFRLLPCLLTVAGILCVGVDTSLAQLSSPTGSIQFQLGDSAPAFPSRSVGLIQEGFGVAEAGDSRTSLFEPEGEVGELEFESEGEEDEIETDRDSFTPSTSVVGSGRLVLESAYSFIDNRDVPETHSYPEILMRYGIGKNMELRFGWNYEIGGASSPLSGNVPANLEESAELESESRITYGAKFQLTEQRGRMPESSFVLQGFVPTAGESNLSQLSATHVFGWKLQNDWVVDFATRYGTGGFEDDKFNVWSPSMVIKMPFGERWKAHVEYAGILSDGREEETAQHYFIPGAHYLINRNFEVGTRVGWGLNDQSARFLINTGIGLRF